MACTCGKCAECDWARHHPDEDDALRSGPGETKDFADALGLTNSAEQPIRCGTFSGMAVRGVKAQFEQANRYRRNAIASTGA